MLANMARVTLSTDDGSAPVWDAEAIERLRQEAESLFVRWLFVPPGLHIRDYAGGPPSQVAAMTPTSGKESSGGETSVVPAA
jgi:hypothetical protein